MYIKVPLKIIFFYLVRNFSFFVTEIPVFLSVAHVMIVCVCMCVCFVLCCVVLCCVLSCCPKFQQSYVGIRETSEQRTEMLTI